MFNWFKKRKEEKQRLEDERLKAEAEKIAKAMIEAEKAEKKRLEEERITQEKEEKRLADLAWEERQRKKRESDEFYLEIVSEEVTEDGVKLKLDWNDACIKYLKNAGIDGPTDEIIVYKYLSALNREAQIEELASQYALKDQKEEGMPAPYTNEDVLEEDEL